jgi:ABC-2 type transport system permease protein
MSRREGSPFTGVASIALKEAADHLTSARMHLSMLLVLLTALGSVYAAIGQLKETVSEDPFLFLRLLTTAQEPLPSFVAFLAFLLPLVAIALGFDAINGEYNRRTMSRILSQPIYRDALLAGKYLGALLIIGICLVTLFLLVTGMGILLLGLPPSGEEILRAFAFLLIALVYAGVWLAAAILFSAVFRAPTTSALAALTLWLVLTVFWSIVTPIAARAFVPDDPLDPETTVRQLEAAKAIGRLSPNTLFGEMTLAILNPATRTLGLLFLRDLDLAVVGSPLPFGQSLVLVWPHFASMIAALLVVFTIAYVVFQRQEIRA